MHRDLKPGNIKIKPDGTVKVLDFGLAKLRRHAGSAQPRIRPPSSMAMTQAGVILGTAAYMAPEQAKGKPVDKRADIWAFGVVLYEMVTGKRLFHGESTTEILASVIKEEPQWERAPVRSAASAAAVSGERSAEAAAAYRRCHGAVGRCGTGAFFRSFTVAVQ